MEAPFRIPYREVASPISLERILYWVIGLLLAVAAALVLIGTVSGLIHAVVHGTGAVDAGIVVLDRILLALIVAELAYTLRFVVRTHEIAVEPFLYIGLIAVVRRLLIVTAQLERGPHTGRAATNLLLELGVLGLLVPALAVGVYLVRRGRALDG
ncbi:MAG: phosphate-starvation-inducible PsiE family protein [Actinomycetota bacterium]